MSRSVVEKATCGECGFDVRENTLFCYNCGTRIADPEVLSNGTKTDVLLQPVGKPEQGLDAYSEGKVDLKAKAALDELTDRIKIGSESTDEQAIALAAAKRKKARSTKRRGREYSWEPVNGPPGKHMLLIALVITLLAAIAVVSTVIWR